MEFDGKDRMVDGDENLLPLLEKKLNNGNHTKQIYHILLKAMSISQQANSDDIPTVISMKVTK
ncbi:hypothetical protein Csa_016134 [Cucumis sativus]|uniref:Uncharacterized protein n=1 Tax=Cucumis sativus TaxID=3659 RepID=A0A0A0K5V9_CUCSA|nr:hypothetical protein Csa_016134 [Cucumis sativus]